jgi:hypothetical protein
VRAEAAIEPHGGPILGYDLQRLANPPELVVPAGCELGLSEVRPGDESFGTATAIARVCRTDAGPGPGRERGRDRIPVPGEIVSDSGVL